MADYRMQTMVLGPVQTNCYLVWNEDTKEAFVVDPAANAQKIVDWLAKRCLTLKAILLTHGHFDHMMAVPGLKKVTGAPVYAGAHEKRMLADSQMNLSGAWAGSPVEFEADHWCFDQESFELCGFTFKVIATPGHTEGGVCYYLETQGQLFAGDTLFYGSFGRYDLPTGDLDALCSSIENRLFKLPDATIVYPGHGQGTSIELEKKINPIARGMRF